MRVFKLKLTRFLLNDSTPLAIHIFNSMIRKLCRMHACGDVPFCERCPHR